ncbi:MAG: hypothetical protein GC150_12520 [Rhizobiales bacterium]|nr:hypothetical protein [Hyphomicrobiales bacterium]
MIARTTTGSGAHAGIGLLALVKALARPNAHLAIGPGTSRWCIAVPNGPDGEMQSRSLDIENSIVEAALSSGVLTRDGGRVRLSPAGLAWLKRRMCDGDGFTGQHRVEVSRPVGPRQADVLVENLMESPLAWLRSRTGRDGKPFISDEAFAAGERLRRDYTFASMEPRVTMSWAPAGGAGRSGRRGPAPNPGDLRDDVLAARERVYRALDAVGRDLALVLRLVCCEQTGIAEVERRMGWSPRSGKHILEIALQMLAVHYGIARPARQTVPRFTHWGADGYRPGLDGD